jgi:hypothetical protein
MPAKSQKQRRWAYGVMGSAWAKRHHFDNKGKLPKQAKKRKGKR